MKTLLYLFLFAMLVIAGCTKENAFFENPNNPELKRANVPIPFKTDCYAIPDWESEPILVSGLNPEDPNSYSISRLIVGGTGTHLGKIDAEKSFYKFEKIEFILEDGTPSTKQSGIGKMVGANGDGFEFSFWAKQSLLDGSYAGVADVIPATGTGKFEGCTGSFDFWGGYQLDGNGLWFKSEGKLVYE